MKEHTRYYPPCPTLLAIYRDPILRSNIAAGSPRYFETGSPTSSHSSRLAIHLVALILALQHHSITIFLHWKPRQQLNSRYLLVGDTEGSLLGTSTHSSFGTASTKYVIAARDCASIEGSEKAGPQTWSSRTIVAPVAPGRM